MPPGSGGAPRSPTSFRSRSKASPRATAAASPITSTIPRIPPTAAWRWRAPPRCTCTVSGSTSISRARAITAISHRLPGAREAVERAGQRIGRGAPMREAAEDSRRPSGLAASAGALRAKLAAAGTFSRYALHRFNRDGCFAASSGLSYMTLVSLVPLGVIAFGILSGFPSFGTLRQRRLGFLFHNLVPEISEQAAYWFTYFAESAAQATAIGIIGTAASGV